MKRSVLAIPFLLVLSLACVAGGATPTAAPTQATDTAFVVTPLVTSEAQPTEATTTPPPVVTTPPPDVTTEAGCTLNSGYVADVTIPDNTQLAPGTAFRKTWRIRNSGTCAWEAGTVLAYVSGDPLGGPATVVAPQAAPGAMVDVSMDFVAPVTPGTYRSNWQLQAPNGSRFGQGFYVQIVVPAPATPTSPPTSTPTPTATPTLPAACVAPDPQFANLVAQAQARGLNVNCATGSVVSMNGATQVFWESVTNPNPNTHLRTYLIWRSDTRKIYEIRGKDASALSALGFTFVDTWDESQPEIPTACSTIAPPTGYIMPIRGFGKHWCTYNWWHAERWPNQPESAVTLTLQPVDNGVLMQVSGMPSGTFWVAIDANIGQATVRLIP